MRLTISNIRLVLLIVIACSVNLMAQDSGLKSNEPWTLQQCIDYALKNNLQLKQSVINTEVNQQNLLQSYGAALPTVNGFAAHTYNFGRTIDPFTNTFAESQVLSQNFSLSASVPLFSGLQTYNTIKQNQLILAASKMDVDKMRNDLSLNIATAYLQVLFAMEQLDNASNQTMLTQKQVQRTQILVDAGSLAKSNLLDIQAQLATEELSLATAQNQLDLAYLTLAQLIELPTTEGFKIVKPEFAIPAEAIIASTPGQIYNAAVSTLPEIKSAEFKLKSTQKGLAVAYGGLSPTLSLSGSLGTGYSGSSKRLKSYSLNGFAPNGDITSTGSYVLSPVVVPEYENISFTDQYDQNVNKSVGLRLTIPIYNGFRNHATINRAKLQQLSSEYALEQAKKQVQKTIQQAYADANAALKKYVATQRSLEASQESFKYTEQKFNLGAVNSLDYNNSKTRLAKSKSDLSQAKYEFIFKSKVLDFYMGKPLAF